MILITAILTAAVMLLSGCAKTQNAADATEQNSLTAAQTSSIGAAETDTTAAEAPAAGSDMFTDRDYEVGYDESTAVTVTLNGTTAACGDVSVTVADGTVTLTQEGTYVLTGTLEGSVVIDMDKAAKPHIILKNADITSADGAALYVAQADKVFVTLADGTVNTLSNGGSFAETAEGVDGAVFSKDDITFNGTGTLTVNSSAGHAIVGKDDVAFTGGTYLLNAASHGVDANDSVRTVNASLTIYAGKDGVHADNADDETKGFVYIAGGSLEISAEGDGISATADVTVEDGAIDIVSGGGSANAEKKTSDGWGQFGGGRMGGDRPGDDGGWPSMPGGDPPDKPDGDAPEKPDGDFPGGPDGDDGAEELAFTSDQSASAGQLAATSDSDSTSIKGIKSDGNIAVNGGSITVDAADDALHANGSVTVGNGTLTLTSGDDGVHANDTLTVSGGAITVTDCYEGLEALSINVTGGTVSVTADDDGLNAAGGSDDSGFGGMRGGDKFGGKGGFGATEGAEINLSGGQISIRAGGDGIDSNGSVTISGGNTMVDCPTQGDTSPFDYETTAAITGGTLVATGSSMMAEGFTENTQGYIAARVGSASQGTDLTVTDGRGNILVDVTPDNSFNYVLISTPEMVSGQTYTLTVGGSDDSVTAQ